MFEVALALLPFLNLAYVFPYMAYFGHCLIWILLIKTVHFPTNHYVRK